MLQNKLPNAKKRHTAFHISQMAYVYQEHHLSVMFVGLCVLFGEHTLNIKLNLKKK